MCDRLKVVNQKFGSPPPSERARQRFTAPRVQWACSTLSLRPVWSSRVRLPGAWLIDEPNGPLYKIAFTSVMGAQHLKMFGQKDKCLKWFGYKMYIFFFFLMKAGIWNQKLGRSRMQSTPTALHSDQSAMVLLHTVPLAFVITKRDRPGEWAKRSRTDE